MENFDPFTYRFLFIILSVFYAMKSFELTADYVSDPDMKRESIGSAWWTRLLILLLMLAFSPLVRMWNSIIAPLIEYMIGPKTRRVVVKGALMDVVATEIDTQMGDNIVIYHNIYDEEDLDGILDQWHKKSNEYSSADLCKFINDTGIYFACTETEYERIKA